ncbi:MAG TPA: ribosome maturation factor RimM [Candidatus Binatia bacterium]|nr:ribosome maturation factor RimM [Candidatus Binatia bacterium]
MSTRQPQTDRITIGVIARPHGLGGAVVLHLDPTMADELHRGLRVRLSGKGDPIDTTIRALAPARSGVRLVLDALQDRDAAERAVGASVCAARADLKGLGEDVYLDSDLLGAIVSTREGTELGPITEIITTGANDVYVVRTDKGEVLVPAIARAVVSVDVALGRVVVEADALEYPA